MRSDMFSILFPFACPGCGTPADPICAECAERLVPPRHVAVPVGLDACVAAFSFEGYAADLVAAMKYKGRRATVGWLCDAIVSALPSAVPPEADPGAVDVVTWAPTTARHRNRRGGDHAAVLARGVGRRLAVPVRPLLRRVSRTSQTGRSRAERRDVAFVARRVPRRVLVVDDVVTTGATLSAAAGALRAQGAIYLVGACVASTPERPSFLNGDSSFPSRGRGYPPHRRR